MTNLKNSSAPAVEYFLPKDKSDPKLKDNMFFFRLGAYDPVYEPESTASEAPEGLYCYSPDHYTLKATGKYYETVSGPVHRTVKQGDFVYENEDSDLEVEVGRGVLIRAEKAADKSDKAVLIVASGRGGNENESFVIDAGNKNVRFAQKNYDSETTEDRTSITKGNKFKFVLGAALTGLLGHSREVNLSFDVKISTFSLSTNLSAALDWKEVAFSYGGTSRTFVLNSRISYYVQYHKRTFLDEEFLIMKNAVEAAQFDDGLAEFGNYKAEMSSAKISIDSSNIDVIRHDSLSY
ncbi:hypothetical protein [uncultured Roseibium sp.]|uniref:hypothetical protein n=1 Tax=uncultured Roseibium sp. TaxID=1936171 RepID=UPI0026376A3F|nr:hypothetical protein [uncultured Roseibium sp.]